MKRTNIAARCTFVSVSILVSCLILLCVLCGQLTAQEFKTLKPGVEYAEVTKDICGLKVNMNLLRLDLKKVRIDVHHAMDAAIGTEKTSSIATRHGGFAAINAGFFRLDTSIWAGDAAGVLMIDKKVLSESSNARASLAIINGARETGVYFTHFFHELDPMIRISPNRNNRFVNNFPLNGINRERKRGEVLVYTPEFGRTTLTDVTGAEAIVSNGRVTKISAGGSNIIPVNGFVISDTAIDRLNSTFHVGDRVHITRGSIDIRDELITDKDIRSDANEARRLAPIVDDVTNGVPQLIKNSKIDITWQEEKSSKSFVETRHPRTAVAKLKDGKFLMITVDGRSELSGGIGLQDLAEYLLSIGATDAMNLDGGGSTTMFVDGKVVNHPSDKEGERKVSDALVVTLRK